MKLTDKKLATYVISIELIYKSIIVQDQYFSILTIDVVNDVNGANQKNISTRIIVQHLCTW